jgi:PAS domain S-box-containing protein
VRATLTLALLHRGRPWGLLACQHRAPRHVPPPQRPALELLGRLLSLQLAERRSDGGRLPGAFEGATEPRQAEAALPRSERTLRTLGDNLPDGAIYQLVEAGDGRVHFTYMSAGIERLLGLTAEEVLADSSCLYDLIVAEDRPLYWAAIAESRRALSVFDCEFRQRTRQGEVKWVHCRSAPRRLPARELAPLPFAGREATVWDGVVVDLTERKRAECALRASEAQLRQTLRQHEVLLKEVHHRVKNNLQVISSLLRLQARHVTDARALEVLRESQDRVCSMALVHENLYRAGGLGQVDLADYVGNLAAALARSYFGTAGRVTVRTDVAPRLLDLDRAVPCGLILNELLSNALKHAFPDGRAGEVWVSLNESAPGQLLLVVEDDGVGRPDDLGPKPAKSLGLQLVQDLTRQLRGSLLCRAPSRGSGTRVEVRIPTS